VTKRQTQQINRAALSGRPRLCPVCQKMVATSRGRFNTHGTPPCTGSGQKVKP